MEFLPIVSGSSTVTMDLFDASNASASSNRSIIASSSRESSSSSSNNNSNENIQPNGSKASSEYNVKAFNLLVKCNIEPEKIYDLIMKTIPSEYAKQIMEKVEGMTESESTSNSKSSRSSEKTNKRKINSSESSSTEVEKAAKKKKELPPIKNIDLFNEWKTKMEEVAKTDLPTMEELDKLDELAENKKHIQINHKFLTQKKNNHTEQVRITYRNFFEKYPKLFYAFSYWTLNGKVKVIKEIFAHHPDLLLKITDIPENYKNFWKEETSEEN